MGKKSDQEGSLLSHVQSQTTVSNGQEWQCGWDHTQSLKHFFFHSFFFFFMATPMACGSSQARGGIRATAEAHTTAAATLDPSHIFDLCCSLWQCRKLHQLNEVRDRTRIFTVTMLCP